MRARKPPGAVYQLSVRPDCIAGYVLLGNLEGLGRVYQQIFIDTSAKVGFGKRNHGRTKEKVIAAYSRTPNK
jgi:hypothetical protein